MARLGKIGGDAGGQTDRAKRRDDFEDDLVGGEVGLAQDDQTAQHDHGAAQHEHGDGLALSRGADSAAERLAVTVAAYLGDDQQGQDGDRANLDTTGGTRAAAADKHKEVVQSPAFMGQGADVDRVEPGGTRRN
ncbi:hypothetical protein D9M70_589960 [compost metagenome]